MQEAFFREELGSVVPTLEGAPSSCDHEARRPRVFDFVPGQSSTVHCADLKGGRFVYTATEAT